MRINDDEDDDDVIFWKSKDRKASTRSSRLLCTSISERTMPDTTSRYWSCPVTCDTRPPFGQFACPITRCQTGPTALPLDGVTLKVGCTTVLIDLTNYPAAVRAAEYCDEHGCGWGCVCLSASISLKPQNQTLQILCMLPMAAAESSSGGVAIRYGYFRFCRWRHIFL